MSDAWLLATLLLLCCTAVLFVICNLPSAYAYHLHAVTLLLYCRLQLHSPAVFIFLFGCSDFLSIVAGRLAKFGFE
jgi:hypothetical protein